jgi:hypothetical protein
MVKLARASLGLKLHHFKPTRFRVWNIVSTTEVFPLLIVPSIHEHCALLILIFNLFFCLGRLPFGCFVAGSLEISEINTLSDPHRYHATTSISGYLHLFCCRCMSLSGGLHWFHVG